MSVPIDNGAAALPRLCAALMAQGYPADGRRVLIVDSASPDRLRADARTRDAHGVRVRECLRHGAVVRRVADASAVLSRVSRRAGRPS